jgi:hypothetical protein
MLFYVYSIKNVMMEKNIRVVPIFLCLFFFPFILYNKSLSFEVKIYLLLLVNVLSGLVVYTLYKQKRIPLEKIKLSLLFFLLSIALTIISLYQ